MSENKVILTKDLIRNCYSCENEDKNNCKGLTEESKSCACLNWRPKGFENITTLVCPNNECGSIGIMHFDFVEIYPTCFTCQRCNSKFPLNKYLKASKILG
jgi:hypothetical protein